MAVAVWRRGRAPGVPAAGRRDWTQTITAITALGELLFTALSLQATREQIKVSEQGQINDRYAKAVELLGTPGAENFQTRLGGIYALERLAFDAAVPAMVRQVVDPDVADWLQVPKSRGWTRTVRAASRVMRQLERREDDNRVARAVLDKAGTLLLTGSVRTLTDGQSTTLTIPEDLRGHWNVPTCPVKHP